MKCRKCNKEMWEAMIGAGNCVNKKCSLYLLMQTSQEHIDNCNEINRQYTESTKNKKWWQL